MSIHGDADRLSRLLLVPGDDRTPPHGVCRPEVIEDVVGRCGATAAAWAAETGRALLDLTVRELAGCETAVLTPKDHELLELVAVWAALWIGGETAPPEPLTADIEDAVRIHVERGFGPDSALTLIRIAHGQITADLLRACEKALPARDLPEAMRHVSATLFDAVETLCRLVSRHFAVERERWQTGQDAQRRTIVGEILRGDPVDVGKASRRLGYDLTQNHLGLLLWSDDSTRGDGLDRTAARILERAGATATLLVPAGAGRLWAWGAVPGTRPHDLSGQPLPLHVRVAAGLPAAGPAGLRLTHDQATTAAGVGSRMHGVHRIHEYRTLQLVALLTADEPAAADFVRRELGALADDSPSAATLRTTLKCYLDHDRSLAAAAQHLHVAKNTVLYRARKAAELRGRPLSENRLQLHAALCLTEALGPAVLRQPQEPVLAQLHATA
ncbi:helix-turn-helix domain-containing protein [Streptomyces sp. CSDS2]|uniref:PucR family transcriptional regulator n=1 Tax=Streptomyces sp. CSDS2 TaxID=3055051 RepID=UPI0025AFAE8F|nr:helix-turn-helix domain-containing protein [Streptomyces sp. CSDS2]MDN3265299.1 helix-turn-helix domain-containing protein [Streptomyces sp. CSDS2]